MKTEFTLKGFECAPFNIIMKGTLKVITFEIFVPSNQRKCLYACIGLLWLYTISGLLPIAVWTVMCNVNNRDLFDLPRF